MCVCVYVCVHACVCMYACMCVSVGVSYEAASSYYDIGENSIFSEEHKIWLPIQWETQWKQRIIDG